MKLNKRISRLFFLAGMAFGLPGCAQEKTFDEMVDRLIDRSVPLVQPDSIAADSGIVYLDAREQREYDVSHIMNAIPVGYDDFALDSVKHVSKDARIVVYCSVGYRSEKVGEKLLKAGFTNVSNLYGGLFHWVNQGHVVYTDGHPTTEVHAYNKRWGEWLEEGGCKKVYE